MKQIANVASLPGIVGVKYEFEYLEKIIPVKNDLDTWVLFISRDLLGSLMSIQDMDLQLVIKIHVQYATRNPSLIVTSILSQVVSMQF